VLLSEHPKMLNVRQRIDANLMVVSLRSQGGFQPGLWMRHPDTRALIIRPAALTLRTVAGRLRFAELQKSLGEQVSLRNS